MAEHRCCWTGSLSQLPLGRLSPFPTLSVVCPWPGTGGDWVGPGHGMGIGVGALGTSGNREAPPAPTGRRGKNRPQSFPLTSLQEFLELLWFLSLNLNIYFQSGGRAVRWSSGPGAEQVCWGPCLDGSWSSPPSRATCGEEGVEPGLSSSSHTWGIRAACSIPGARPPPEWSRLG